MSVLPVDETRPKHKLSDLSEERVLDILRTAHWGVLSTVNADGEPYGVPISFALDEKDYSLVFHSTIKGAKAENFQRDERVCFTVVGSSELITGKFSAGFESIVVFGHIRRIDDHDEALAAAVTFCRKFAPGIVAGMDVEAAEEEINDMALMIDRCAGHSSMYRILPTHVSSKQRNMGQRPKK